ncbi:hypothetical protein HOI04_02410, partial [archaeon]|nr:hypothetical protein [archaeon]
LYQLSSEDLTIGTALPLNELDRVFFSLDLEDHILTTGIIGETSVVVNIASDPIELTLNVGVEEKIDLDGDGDFDLSLLLNSVTDDSVDMKFLEISGNVVDETGGESGFEAGEIDGARRLSNLAIYGVGIIVIFLVILVAIYLYRKKKTKIKRRRVLRK